MIHRVWPSRLISGDVGSRPHRRAGAPGSALARWSSDTLEHTETDAEHPAASSVSAFLSSPSCPSLLVSPAGWNRPSGRGILSTGTPCRRRCRSGWPGHPGSGIAWTSSGAAGGSFADRLALREGVGGADERAGRAAARRTALTTTATVASLASTLLTCVSLAAERPANGEPPSLHDGLIRLLMPASRVPRGRWCGGHRSTCCQGRPDARAPGAECAPHTANSSSACPGHSAQQGDGWHANTCIVNV